MTKVSNIDAFGHTFVDACVKQIISERVGFVNTECTFVKTLLKGVVYKTLSSSNVLNNEAKDNLKYVARRLTYD